MGPTIGPRGLAPQVPLGPIRRDNSREIALTVKLAMGIPLLSNTFNLRTTFISTFNLRTTFISTFNLRTTFAGPFNNCGQVTGAMELVMVIPLSNVPID
jgi:hypothetical protein